ncbi:MAG: PDZ domain-containing protein, partial [Nanoarchaeota archaeon]|nr:PDZ domain-containing protein [Nanoarchaeota archaeon]
MKKYMTTRVWILLIALVLALIAISPNPWASGIEVVSVDSGSDADLAGLGSGDILLSINGNDISSVQDVLNDLTEMEYDEQEVTIETTEETLSYTITNDMGIFLGENLTILTNNVGLTDDSVILSVNGVDIETNDDYDDILDELIPKQTIKIETVDGLVAYLSREVPDITVSEATKSNLVFGLDFTGGTRVLLQPVSEDGITDEDIQSLIEVLSNRLNVYGLSDVKIRSAEDWSGNKFVLVEIAGITETKVRELISQQGVFEATIGDSVVFNGGEKDVTYVCRNDGTCSGVRTCDQSSGQYYCNFQFSINLSPEAAAKFAAATADLSNEPSETGTNE